MPLELTYLSSFAAVQQSYVAAKLRGAKFKGNRFPLGEHARTRFLLVKIYLLVVDQRMRF